MRREHTKQPKPLSLRYPPSPPCRCDICLGYCQRPGWWTVEEARRALLSGYGGRMMLEVSADRSIGVLSPAFRDCEGKVALQVFAHNGCTFLKEGLCELYGTGFQPLECRFCHHTRKGRGIKCHEALERDWRTAKGQGLVSAWIRAMGLLKGSFGMHPTARP